MGNQQSAQAGNYQLTPEQYQQYQLFLQNQAWQQQQQARQQPKQVVTKLQQQQVRPQQTRQTQPSQTVGNQFQQIQQQRTQVRVANQNADQKIIPTLQKKVNTGVNLQSAYNQRMTDNFQMRQQQSTWQDVYQNQISQQQHQFIESNPPIFNVGLDEQQQQVTQYQDPRYQQYVKQEQAREHAFLKQQIQQQNDAYRKFKADQDRQRRQFFEELDEIQSLKYNPEQILGLTQGVKHSENEIKTAYRNLAMKYHPDKGGSEEIFKILTKAYMFLLKQAQGANYVEKNFMDLKGDYSQPQQQEGGGYIPREEDFNVRHFNQVFDENRLEDDEWDTGYGDWKTEDTSEEPKKIFNQKFTLDVFNSVFNELRGANKAKETTDIQVYQEPEILSSSGAIAHREVDYRKGQDYTKEYSIQDGSSKNGIYYMDYKKAYTETTLIDPIAVKERKGFKNVQEAKMARETQDFTMTEEERAYYEEKKRVEAQAEAERLERLKQRDERLAQHSTQVNQLMLGGQPTRQLEYKRR